MQLNAYSVYDRKALVYGAPFYAPTDGAAVRSFQSLANDVSTTVGQYPGDFVLFHVGTYNDQDGALVRVSPLRHVADATALLVERAQLSLFGQEQRDGAARPFSNGEAK